MKRRSLFEYLLLAGVAVMVTNAGLSPIAATEYFVSKSGDDANDGLLKETALLTIQKGIDALQPGDTLTIGPGEYAESVKRNELGNLENDTVIRAEIPQTVHLRGDIPAPKFRKVEGYRYVFVADFDGEVQTVNELDTRSILQTVTTIDELEFTPGGCYHDSQNGKLYISSSDMKSPDLHHYTVSTIRDFGLLLTKPKRVIVDGLTTSGFHSSSILRYYPGSHTVWGIMAAGARQCVIRNCVAFLNGGGIGMFSSNDDEGYNLIEKCRAFANYTKFTIEGGNICGFQSYHDEIRDCYAYLGKPNGMRLYGAGIRGPAVMKNCLVWGSSYADIFLKGGQAPKYAVAENCISLGILHSLNVKHCLIGTMNQYNRKPDADTIMPLPRAALQDEEFADPINLDFRLQSTSKYRSAAPDGSDRGPFPYEANIFYVSPSGDDESDGLSVKGAWKSLDRALRGFVSGSTLYLEGGDYALSAKVAGLSDVSILGRGNDPVVIRGSLSVANLKRAVFERLSLVDEMQIQASENVSFKNCRFSSATKSLSVENVAGLRITHGEFTQFRKSALNLADCTGVYLSGNVFDNQYGPAVQTEHEKAILYSDYNAYRTADNVWRLGDAVLALKDLTGHGRHSRVVVPKFETRNGTLQMSDRVPFNAGGPNGTGLGFYREYERRSLQLDGPMLHSVTDTTANIEWWTSFPAKVEVAWGNTPACENTTTLSAETFGTFSLTGLKPGRRYYFRIVSAAERHSSAFATSLTDPIKPNEPPLEFNTVSERVAPRTFYVSPDGNNDNDGLDRDRSWKTVGYASAQIRAGDTVLIAGGTYRESVRVRATGDEGKPVTFKAIPGERVDFDGDARKITVAFAVSAKKHVHFDGLYFKMFGNGGWESIFNVFDSEHIQVTRCLMNGATGAGNSPQLLRTHDCNHVLLQNCVIASGFQGTYFTLTRNLRIENNVFLRNLICPILNSGGGPKDVQIRNNIFVDSIPSKVQVHYFELGGIEQYVFDNNCFYMRLPDAERRPFLFYGTGPGRISIGEYEKIVGSTHSIMDYPRFRMTEGIEPKDRDGKKIEFLADWLAGQKDMDFDSLYSAHPELIKSGIGLRPDDFKDFHFNK